MTKERVKRGQAEMVFRQHGGKRPGAGRKPNGKRPGARHEKRPEHNPRHPMHVTIRIYLALREATIVTAGREGFRIVHMSIQRDHVHLIVEAQSKAALSKGVRGFSISAARQINKVITARGGDRRTGKVIGDRFQGLLPRNERARGKRVATPGSLSVRSTDSCAAAFVAHVPDDARHRGHRETGRLRRDRRGHDIIAYAIGLSSAGIGLVTLQLTT
jgi:REP element-mobilizing transposase RayT